MDKASDDVAKVFAGARLLKVLASDDRTWIPVAANGDPKTAIPYKPKAEVDDGRNGNHPPRSRTVVHGDRS